MIVIPEEIAISALKSVMEDVVPGILEEISAEKNDNIDLPMFIQIAEKYVHPYLMDDFPSGCFWVESSRDEVKNRLIDQNTEFINFLYVLCGEDIDKQAYRYAAAIKETLKRNLTLNNQVGSARLVSREFNPPEENGDLTKKICLLQIAIEQEL